MRILVTGSRSWGNRRTIHAALIDTVRDIDLEKITLVSGGCPTGADRMAEEFAENMGWTVERHPADWRTYGKRAGFLRNIMMVKLGADICLAFVRDESRGASMTAALAIKNGIKTRIFKE